MYIHRFMCTHSTPNTHRWEEQHCGWLGDSTTINAPALTAREVLVLLTVPQLAWGSAIPSSQQQITKGTPRSRREPAQVKTCPSNLPKWVRYIILVHIMRYSVHGLQFSYSLSLRINKGLFVSSVVWGRGSWPAGGTCFSRKFNTRLQPLVAQYSTCPAVWRVGDPRVPPPLY